MSKDKTKDLTRQIAITAILLAVCMASQFFKSLSVYITGPIINLCTVLVTLTAGLAWGLALAVITPVTAFFIAASPVMTAVPGILPLIMLGNASLVLMVYFLFRPAISGGKPLVTVRSVIMAILACAVKGCVMGATIALWLLPTFLPQASPLRKKLPTFQKMFSITQAATALIGFVYFFILWIPVRKILKQQGEN